MQYFNIQVASQLSGVASATIRAWEKRYNAVIPERAENKHRLYSEKDIEKLALLYKLTEFGQSIGKIAHLELDELKEVYSTLLHRPYEERHIVTPFHDKIDFEKMIGNFFLALHAYKLDIISHELEKAKAVLGPMDLCLSILVPLRREVRMKVSQGEISLGQERILQTIFAFHIGELVNKHYQKSFQKNDIIILATPLGNSKELDLLGAALLCIHFGIKFVYLNTNLHALALAETVNDLRARTILLTVNEDQENLEQYLQDLQHNLTVSSEILICGQLGQLLSSALEKKGSPIFPTLESLAEKLESF